MKKGILFLVLALSLIVLQSADFVSANELTDDYLDIATNYLKSNDYPKAIEYLNIILCIEPDNLVAKKMMDQIQGAGRNIGLNETKEPEQTAKDADVNTAQNIESYDSSDIVKDTSDKIVYNSDYYNTKGKEFYLKKEFDTAIEYFCKAITVDKSNAQAYNNLAMAYLMKNNPAEAIKYFKKANIVNKNYTQPLVNLAAVYRQLKDKKSQLFYLQKAVKLNSNDYLAYYYLGDYYRCEGNYPQAIENYKEVVKINPKFAQVYLNLAMSFFETEEFNYTILSLNQYLEFYPNSDFAFLLAARANLALCNYENAKLYIQKALEINDCTEYKFELAKIDYYLGDYSISLDILQNLLKAGDSAEIYNYIGLCNYKLKNIDAAIVNIKKAIELDGLRPIYYYNLAQCYKSLGDKKNYSKYVTTATKITPINYQDFIDLSYIYYDNGNPGYAINSLNNAISKYPDVKSLYLSKLKIYQAIGDNLHYNETKDLIQMRFNRK